MSSDIRCHGAAAVLSVFTVRLSPLFQYSISNCNSVYGGTLLSNLSGSSAGSLHVFLYSVRNAAFVCCVTNMLANVVRALLSILGKFFLYVLID